MSLIADARKYIAGGVNSPVRAFASVGGDAHPAVVAAVTAAAADGLSFGAPTIRETELARKICEFLPSVQRVRMVNSGTEATMSAIRLARGFTGRDKIVKFEGCYHGHSDSLLIKAGSGALTLGVPSSPGVPAALAGHTISLEYNNVDAVAEAFERLGSEIAAVIVEPVAGNMNMVLPEADFLPALRKLCDASGSLLIFDEVMTGFRVARGGAQELFDVRPDLTTLGKIIGGGLPAAAFGGRADIMAQLSPDGPVYQAGTLSGNPLATAAGLATLIELEQPGFYASLAERTALLTGELSKLAARSGVPFAAEACGGMFGFVFSSDAPVRRYAQVAAADLDRFRRFFHGMLERGVYLAPSAFEAAFVSAAHNDEDISRTLEAASKTFAEL